LVVIGEPDMPRMHAYSDLFTAGIPGARKVVIPGCDHAPNMGEADECNGVVLSFLTEVESCVRCRESLGRGRGSPPRSDTIRA
jgi:hypothetical protein